MTSVELGQDTISIMNQVESLCCLLHKFKHSYDSLKKYRKGAQ